MVLLSELHAGCVAVVERRRTWACCICRDCLVEIAEVAVGPLGAHRGKSISVMMMMAVMWARPQ